MIERERGQFHVPSHRDGCYHQRLTDCCWLCYWRLLAVATAGAIRRSRE